MNIWDETCSAPSLTLPRKRARGPAVTGAGAFRQSSKHIGSASIQQSALPLPLAGKCRGGGSRTMNAAS